VVLSYTFPGANDWIPISSDQTNEAGQYNVQWINSASGTFTLKTEWNGDATYDGASNTTTLSFLPYQSQQVFIVESNSTVSQLAFNSTSAELSFTVSGVEGTTGFVKATIAKSLISNGADVTVFLDGNQLNYTLTSTDESWVLLFNYSHSTHEVAVYMGSMVPVQSPSPSPTAVPTLAPSVVPTVALTVTPSQTSSFPFSTSSPKPEQTGFSGTNLLMEYGYLFVVALVVILIVVATAFALRKRR
jgi:hypothetical protein